MARQNSWLGAIESSRKGQPRISIPRMTPGAPKPGVRRGSPGAYPNDSGAATPGRRKPTMEDLLGRATDAANSMGQPDWVGEAMADPKTASSVNAVRNSINSPSIADALRPGSVRGGGTDLNKVAQERANALRKGGFVTQDFNPERERLVEDILRGQNPTAQPLPAEGQDEVFNTLRAIVDQQAPSSRSSQRRSQPGKGAGVLGGRTIEPWERARYGIDPRDPNMFWVTPDGKIGQTLIGWDPNPMPMDFPKIPTANTLSSFLNRFRR